MRSKTQTLVCVNKHKTDFREKRPSHVEVQTLVENRAKSQLSCMVTEVALKVRFALSSTTRNVKRYRRLGADIFG